MPYQDLGYLYISIRTIFVIGGITLLVYQYYNIMKSGTRDYCILKALGATKHNIRKLILMQVISLIIITIPLGLFLGNRLTNMILNFFADVTMSNSAVDIIDSSNTILLASGSLCAFIICIGIYMERGIQKTSLANILSERFMTRKEVE
jgi:predicted lysophospholipase L1 biosynthesis ABC-type transport system permease subunit